MTKKLVLVDAYSIIFRAFYSVPPLTRQDGVQVGAVYGFISILMHIINQLRPDYLAVAFDHGGKTFRHEEYREYKANRLEAPEELKPQFNLVREASRAMGLWPLEKAGYEADDLIATLVKRYRDTANLDLDIYIVSGDKDLMQLVGPNVFLYDGSKDKTYQAADVVEKFGITTPAQVLDILALMGDSSDNIPGVPGIGPKGAAELISKYQSLEGLYDNLDSLPHNKRYEKLLQYKEQAFLSKKLATLADEVPLDDTLEHLAHHPPEPKELLRFLHQQNFRSLIYKVEKEFGVHLSAEELLELQQSHPTVDTGKTDADQATTLFNFAEMPEQGNLPLAPPMSPPEQSDINSLEAITLPTVQYSSSVDMLYKLSQTISYQGCCFLDVEYYHDKQEKIIGLKSLTIILQDCQAHLVKIQPSHNAVNQAMGDLLSGMGEQSQEDSKQTSVFDSLSETAVLAVLKPLLEDHSILKVIYGAKELYRYLYQHNLELTAFDDLQVMSYILEAGRSHYYYLSDLINNIFSCSVQNPQMVNYISPTSQKFYRQLAEIILMTEKGKDLQEHLDSAGFSLSNYYALRAYLLVDLYRLLRHRLYEEKLCTVYYNIDRPLIAVLAKIESRGILLDQLKLRELSEEYNQRIQVLEQEIYRETGEEFKIASPKQLGHILFEKMNLPLAQKGTGKSKDPSTNSEVLEELSTWGYTIADKVLEWRRLSKLKSTFTDALGEQIDPHTGRIHTILDATATNTGRLASNSPNLQNIPIREDDGAKIRAAFIAPKGHKLIAADYSQIELRVLAHVAQVKALQQSFRQHEDIHRRTASQIFNVSPEEVTAEMRRHAKAINFGIIYGLSGFGLAKQIKVSNSEASNYIQNYLKNYPEIQRFTTETTLFAQEHGYVNTVYGRRCFIPDAKSNNRVQRRFAERVAVNAPIQGAAADITKKAMIRLEQAIQQNHLRAKILLQIHDELLIECPEEEVEATAKLCREIMEHVVWLDVPLEVGIGVGDNWLQAH